MVASAIPCQQGCLGQRQNAFSRGVPKHGVVGRVDHDMKIIWTTRGQKVLDSLSIIGWPAPSQRPGVPVQFRRGSKHDRLFLRHAFRLLCVPFTCHLHTRDSTTITHVITSDGLQGMMMPTLSKIPFSISADLHGIAGPASTTYNLTACDTRDHCGHRLCMCNTTT